MAEEYSFFLKLLDILLSKSTSLLPDSLREHDFPAEFAKRVCVNAKKIEGMPPGLFIQTLGSKGNLENFPSLLDSMVGKGFVDTLVSPSLLRERDYQLAFLKMVVFIFLERIGRIFF